MEGFTKEQAAINEKLPGLRQELDSINEVTTNIEDWLHLISKYLELKELDRETVTGLIDKITVSERVKNDGIQTQSLEIEYRFIGNLIHDGKEYVA